jgi:hypothetical protein
VRFVVTLAAIGFALLAFGGEASAGSDTNAANSPTEPRLTFQWWNYYAPSLHENSDDAENGLGRILIPFKVDGIQQIFHIFPPVVTDPNANIGPRTGLGDIQLFNFTLTKYELNQSQTLTAGIGPLLALPTATSSNFGPRVLQGGVAGILEARLSWGIVGVLATYQHTLWGAGSEQATVQPILYYNLPWGFYLRSGCHHAVQHLQPHKCCPRWGRLRQGVPSAWRLPVERLCRSPTLRLSRRGGRAQLPGLHRHPNTVPA